MVFERFNVKLKKWEEVEFKDISEGDIFRAFKDGIRHIDLDGEGNNVWIAASYPYENSDGQLIIDVLY